MRRPVRSLQAIRMRMLRLFGTVTSRAVQRAAGQQGEFNEGFTPKRSRPICVSLEGVKLWHILLAGGVTKGLLSFEAIQAIAFEFADATLAHTHEAALQPFGGVVRT